MVEGGKVMAVLRRIFCALLLVSFMVSLRLMADERHVVADFAPTAEIVKSHQVGDVHVRWLGVSSLLFDDGETQILIDAFFSRPFAREGYSDKSISPDAEAVKSAIKQFDMNRLAAVIPVHSHYDHAMDLGGVALETGAVVVGSSSTVNIARGAGVSEALIKLHKSGAVYKFGDFTVRLLKTAHSPTSSKSLFRAGLEIDAPLVPPQPAYTWSEGGSYTIILEHPRGTSLVQGSAGYVDDLLADEKVDVAFLGVGGLDLFGKNHAEIYWQQHVGLANPARVFPLHHDDFIGHAFGDVAPLPFGEPEQVYQLLNDMADRDGVLFQNLPFGQPVKLF